MTLAEFKREFEQLPKLGWKRTGTLSYVRLLSEGSSSYCCPIEAVWKQSSGFWAAACDAYKRLHLQRPTASSIVFAADSACGHNEALRRWMDSVFPVEGE